MAKRGMNCEGVSLTSHGDDRFTAEWSDETHRYHVWLNANGTPELPRSWDNENWMGIIYKNPLCAYKEHGGSRTQKLNLYCHPAVVEAIEKLGPADFIDATNRRLALEQAEEARHREQRLETIRAEAAAYGYVLVERGAS